MVRLVMRQDKTLKIGANAEGAQLAMAVLRDLVRVLAAHNIDDQSSLLGRKTNAS